MKINKLKISKMKEKIRKRDNLFDYLEQIKICKNIIDNLVDNNDETEIFIKIERFI